MARYGQLLLAVLLLGPPASAATSAGATPGAGGAQAYVEGRLASQEQDLGRAAARFAAALKQAPGDVILRRRALEVAILAGDRKAAFHHAEALEAARIADARQARGAGDALVALTAIASAASTQSWGAVDRAREGFVEPRPRGDSEPVLGTIIDAWSAAARGRMADAVRLTGLEGAAGISRSYLAEHRAHILGLAGRWPEAADAYAALVAAEGANVPRLRVAAAAAALEAARADPKQAKEWRDRAMTLLGGGPANDPILVDARARFVANPNLSGRALGGLVTHARDGIALLFLRVSADLGRNRADSAALHFARLASFVAPRMPEAWLVVADTLIRQERADLALAALDQAPAGPPWDRLLALRRAGALAQQERWDAARAILAAATARPDTTPDDLVRLAQLERQAKRHEAAAAGYERAAEAMAAAGAADGAGLAQLWFLGGASWHEAGDWAKAEAALRKAVLLAPDNPIILNYLGYSLLDRGESMAEARALIARAYAAAPDNGAIIDSMGWAAYAAGDYPEAVRLLEQARAAEPGDPTIADHLGDALWKVGRRIEARYMWKSARALEPEEALAKRLAAKLDIGLDAVLAAQ